MGFLPSCLGPPSSLSTSDPPIPHIFSHIQCFCFEPGMFLLFTFTLAESYLVASICSLYEEAPEVVLMAAVTTLALFIGLTIFACCCKMMKLTFCWAIGAAISFCMWPMFLFMWIYPSEMLYNMFCVLGCILFSIYIIFDTKMIQKYLSVDEYIIGALMIYIDVI